MKNILAIFMVVLFFASCEDFLEEDVSTVVSVTNPAMKQYQGMQLALAGAYKPLSFTWEYGFSTASTQGILMGSDDLTTQTAANKADFRELDQFNVTDLNYRLAFTWDGCYKSIQGANLLISSYEDGLIGTDEELAEMNGWAGEGYFLRAYNYFWIARLWQQAPLMLESHIYDPATIDIEPVQTEALYNQILVDLDSAISLLPNKRQNSGRAGKAAAIAIKAEALLHMAGWPLHQTERYAQAAEVARELIENGEEYGVALNPDFADLWDKMPEPDAEEVFALTFNGGEDNWNVNSQFGASSTPNHTGGWSDFFVELTFFNEYPDQYRKEVTFLTEFTERRQGQVFTTTWEEFDEKRPFYDKFYIKGNDWTHALSQKLERLAEVYFIFAEAQVMATGNTSDPDALEALNTIVRRAYNVPLYEPSVHDYTSATQAQIVQEKAWEFAGEYCRWFDITRTEILEDVVAAKHPDDLQPLATPNYWMPVPGTETLVNANLAY